MYKFGIGSARGLFPVVVTFTVDRWDDCERTFTIEPRQEPGEPDDLYGQFIQMQLEYRLRHAFIKYGHRLNMECMSPEDLECALIGCWSDGYRLEGDPKPFFDSKTGRYIHEGDDPADNVPVICGDCFQEGENPYPWEDVIIPADENDEIIILPKED